MCTPLITSGSQLPAPQLIPVGLYGDEKKSPAAKKSGGKLRRLTHDQRVDVRRRETGGGDGGTSGGHGGLGQ